MGKTLNLKFESSLTELCEVNSSFDAGVLKICYTGENRNKSNISKSAIKNSLKTIYNCPLVCNYNREDGTFGGHDIAVVTNYKDELAVVNLTQPVGVIPESANTWFEKIEDEDGTVHEYLFADVLIWKRQEAYEKLKEDGICSHSMEINVLDSTEEDGILYIKKFEFTAFALIGVEPCFEGSSIEVFSKDDFGKQFTLMLQDMKESFNLIGTSEIDVDDKPFPQQENYTEGGETVLENKRKGIGEEIDDDSIIIEANGDGNGDEDLNNQQDNNEQLDNNDDDPIVDDDEDEIDDDAEDEEDEEENSGDNTSYALSGDIRHSLAEFVEGVKVVRSYGGESYEASRYWFVDYDPDLNEVYAEDTEDGYKLFGFNYTLNGDDVVVDFECKKRKKWAIVDYVEGSEEEVINIFNVSKEHIESDCEAKYSRLMEELDSLREYKAANEAAVMNAEKNAILEKFEDLTGVEEFINLKDSMNDFSVEALEEKCYAIRGRNITNKNFSVEITTQKLPVDATIPRDEESTETLPYGGVVEKYRK